MKCKECNYIASVIARTCEEEEFITSIPAWWIDEETKEKDIITAIFICPKCGAVQ